MQFPDWQARTLAPTFLRTPSLRLPIRRSERRRAQAQARSGGVLTRRRNCGQAAPGVIGDPQVLLPGEFDDRWHMFCIGHGHFFHYESDDGVAWELAYDYLWRSGPTSLIHDGTQWIVYYSNHKQWPECSDSGISVRTSRDLTSWSDPIDLIAPALDWELEGPVNQVRNPCVHRSAGRALPHVLLGWERSTWPTWASRSRST